MRQIMSIVTLGVLLVGAVAGCSRGGTTANANNTKVRKHLLTSGVISVASADSHSLALMRDGTVWAWGSNVSGQLGDGTNSSSDLPVQASKFTEAIAIAAGGSTTSQIVVSSMNSRGDGGVASQGHSTTVDHSLALKKDGTVWAWGDNANGELGNGTTNSSNVPIQVKDLTGVAAISAGDPSFSVALKKDGTVWAWGDNESGQLGNGTTNRSNTPVQVKGLTGVTQISAGGYSFCLALKNDGTVWAWGWGLNGELGNGTNSSSLNPVRVKRLTGVAAVAAGGNHNLALMQDGTVWAWGAPSFGSSQGTLGNGEDNERSNIPVQVRQLQGIVAIAANGENSLVLTKDGTVWAWGDNISGQLGDGTANSSNKPVQVRNLAGVTSIASGPASGFAQTKDGAVWVWGDNSTGRLANAVASSGNVPVRLSSLSRR